MPDTDTWEKLGRDLAQWPMTYECERNDGEIVERCCDCDAWADEPHKADCLIARAHRLVAQPEQLPEAPFPLLGSLDAEGS